MYTYTMLLYKFYGTAVPTFNLVDGFFYFHLISMDFNTRYDLFLSPSPTSKWVISMNE